MRFIAQNLLQVVIVSQDPNAEMMVKEGLMLPLMSAKEEKANVIPNVVNRTVADAEFVLKLRIYPGQHYLRL